MDKNYFMKSENDTFELHMVKSLNLLNIFWKPVKDVLTYKIELYLSRHSSSADIFQGNVYKLKTFVVDRNECMLRIDDLVTVDTRHYTIANYIVKIFAEDRNGKVIAESKGLGTFQISNTW